ncbi:hypothetical protein [Enterococcus hirae]
MDEKVIETLSKKLKKENVNADVIGLSDIEYKTLITEMEKDGLISNVMYASNVPFYFEVTEKGKSKIN